MTKVRIYTQVDLAGVDGEELWAKPVGDDTYVVDSIPLVDTELALGDVVHCVPVGGRLHVDRVLLRGGNSTLRILPNGVELAARFREMGFRVRQGPAGVVGVSLAPDNPTHGLNSWLDTLLAQDLVQLAPGYQAAPPRE